MTIAWRLCRQPYADLSGEGARRVGGRWNSPGLPVVYASADAALAVLEVRVHLDLPLDSLPDDYLLLRIDLTNLETGRVHVLPEDTRAVGDAWLRTKHAPLLDVPSVIVPESRNLLLDPQHPAANSARIGAARSFAFDRRLWLP